MIDPIVADSFAADEDRPIALPRGDVDVLQERPTRRHELVGIEPELTEEERFGLGPSGIGFGLGQTEDLKVVVGSVAVAEDAARNRGVR